MSGLSGIFTSFVVLSLLFHTSFSDATTFLVGDDKGWDLSSNPETWPRGKTFYAGDVLVFIYQDGEVDVCVVNQKGYDTCTLNGEAKKYYSGNDIITLNAGPNYFIASVPSLCQGGLKMAINATSH